MRKYLFFAVILMLTGLSACSKKNNPSIKAVVVSTASTGTWKISSFIDNGIDLTSGFTGYVFTFGASNILSVTNNSNTYTGSWNIISNNGKDDILSDVDFVISFSSPSSLVNLSEDFEILSRTDTKIELRHISGGGGGTQFLTFLKN